jgi:hypothetical protein
VSDERDQIEEKDKCLKLKDKFHFITKADATSSNLCSSSSVSAMRAISSANNKQLIPIPTLRTTSIKQLLKLPYQNDKFKSKVAFLFN